MPVLAPSTKELLIRSGEELFAQHGIDGVSMLEIGAAAGSGNKSAVQYHFGSKDQLVQAIFEFRLPTLHGRRAFLIREREPNDLRGWVECQARALLEQSEVEDSHYMGFVAMLHEHGRRDLFQRMSPEFRQSANVFHEQLGSCIEHVPEPLRSRRIATGMAIILHAAAARERARASGQRVLTFAVELADLVDGMVGFFSAEVSPEARRAVAEADPDTVAWPLFL